MPRRFIPPPLGLPRVPNYAISVGRRAELLAEFLKRLSYVQASYRFALRLSKHSFNESLARLQRTVRDGPTLAGRGELLHPYLQLAINLHARRLATERTRRPDAEIIKEDVANAAVHVASTVKANRGRPSSQVLDHHVAGLMALIQETCGLTLKAIRETSADGYGPRLPGVSQILLFTLREVDPSITETQLVNKVQQLRRNYADKPMRFRDFFPFYGATIDAEGQPVCAPPLSLESFARYHPIYCR